MEQSLFDGLSTKLECDFLFVYLREDSGTQQMIVVRTDVLRSVLVQVSFYCSYLESSSCSGGWGHCKDDTGCQDPHFYSCREGTCLETSVFPSHLYPNNAILLSATDSCCTRRCNPNFYICKVTGTFT